MALLIKNRGLGHFHRPHKDLRSSPPGFFFQTDQGNPYCNILCMAGPLKAAKPDGQWGTPPTAKLTICSARDKAFSLQF